MDTFKDFVISRAKAILNEKLSYKAQSQKLLDAVRDAVSIVRSTMDYNVEFKIIGNQRVSRSSQVSEPMASYRYFEIALEKHIFYC